MEKVRLLEVCDVYQPKTISMKEFVEQGEYTVYGANGPIGKYDKFNHEEAEVVMACRGSSCGAINISKPFSWVNGNAMVIHPNGKAEISKRYLQYCLVNTDKKKIISGTAQPQITRQNLADFEIDLCDKIEQDRIVAFLDERFLELDKIVETLQLAKKQLSVYRQSVLKDEFKDCNNLTEIKNMTSIVTSGSRGWAKYYSGRGAKFIRIGNLTRNSIDIDLEDMQYVDLPESTEGKRSKLVENDVLVSITADLGSIGLVPDNIGEAYVNQHIAMIRFKNPKQGRFMAWYLRSDYGQKYLLKNKRGGGKLGLGLEDIREAMVPNVSDELADMIVTKIEEKLSVCECIENTIDKVLKQASAMRQSILRQAFEGDL